MLSCGKDVTGPRGSALRYARGLSWNAMFPSAFQALGGTGSSVVPFSRVHVLLQHSDGTVALDTVLDFPSGVQSISLSLTVPLLADAPAAGEPMTLTLSYLNGTSDTVFQGGPVTVTIAPAPADGSGNPPIQIPVRYMGIGANAATVVIAPRGTTVPAGSPFSFSAVAKDGASLAIPGTPVIWTSLDPTIAGITAVTAGAGVAGLQRGSARIVAQLLTGPADTVLLNITLPATQIIAQGGNGQTGSVGAQLALPLVVKVAAGDGVGVSGVTVFFTVATGAGTVTNASVVSDANGLAQTSWTLGPAAGTQSVTATSGTLTNSPITFTALAQASAASKLEVTTQPSNSSAGAALAPIVITAKDINGNIATAFTGPVTLALGANPGGATLAGTVTVAAVGGVATFSGISLNKAATGYTLIASSSGITSATTHSFDIAAGLATQLVVTTQPSNGTAGIPIAAIVITAQDGFGNAAPTFTGPVTLALSANPGGATLSGTLTVAAVSGVATFANISLDKPATGYTLSASSGAFKSVVTAQFSIAAALPAQLVVTTQPTNGTAGVALSPVVITAKDNSGNVASTFTGAVTLAFGANPSAATLGGTLTVNAVAGVATFSTLTVSKDGTGYTLKASSAGLTGVTTTPFTISAAAPVALFFTVAPPASTVAGTAFSPALVVTAKDALGNVATSFTGTVTLGFGANPTSATLGGTISASAVAGVATFSNVSVSRAGSGYTLAASATGLANATSPAFAITAGSATQLVVSAQPANGTAGIALAPIGITAEDGFGNVASSFTGPVTLALNANPGGSTLGGTLTASAVGGVATFNNISLNKAANGYTLNASSGALTTATTTSFNIVAGPAASIAINGGNNQSARVNNTLATPLSVIVRDAGGNTVSGVTVQFAVLTGGGHVSVASAVSNATGVAATSWTLGPTVGSQTVSATATGLTGSPLTFSATAQPGER